jgi:hypothetical protein
MFYCRKGTYKFIFVLLFFAFTKILSAQCMLANPSFEIIGSNGNIFAGWQQFGDISSSSFSHHGLLAARVNGLNNGGWDVSAFWQRLDCEPNEQWEISGYVKHSTDFPLTGDCLAIVNVEWRNSNNDLIDYDSFPVANSMTPTDDFIHFSHISSPAPPGTVATHLLVGVLQSPYDSPPEVFYDQISFYSTTPPTVSDMQWEDFPDGRTIFFAERESRVKGTGWYGPGPNHFSHLPESVWVDESGQLHLTIKEINNIWYSTEVVLEEAIGYGDYIFTTRGSLNQLDAQAVLGLFLWQYGACWEPDNVWWNPYNEIDIEFSRWGNPSNEIGQFVAQPWDWAGNIDRFDAEFAENELSSHAFKWLPDRIEFRSWRGEAQDESPENLIHEWIYTGPHIPRPEQPRVHVNLWKLAGSPSANQEVILNNFTFVPRGNANQVVENLQISVENSFLTLQWTSIPQASQYHIYESENPEGNWTKIITCETNAQTFLISGDKKFYQVTWE